MLRRVWLVVSVLAGCGGEGGRSEGGEVVGTEGPAAGGKGTEILGTRAPPFLSRQDQVLLEWEPVAVSEGLSALVVDAVLRRNHTQVRHCYSRAWRQDPALGERSVTVRFTLGPDGSRDISTTPEAFGTPSVPACIAARFRHWDWPPPEKTGTVTVAFRFTPG